MQVRCENCGNLALEGDAVCWHCGHQIPGREEHPLDKVAVSESWEQPLSLSSLVIYAALTSLIILAAILVLRALGERPLIQVNMGARPPEGWQRFTDVEDTFTLWLPEEWDWLDGKDPQDETTLSELLEADARYLATMTPLTQEIEDVELLFIATSPESLGSGEKSLVIVGRSEILNRLSYEDAQAYLLNSNYDFLETSIVEEFEKDHLSLSYEVDGDVNGADRLRCGQQFIHGKGESLLIAACSPSSQYAAFQEVREMILGTFQPLSS